MNKIPHQRQHQQQRRAGLVRGAAGWASWGAAAAAAATVVFYSQL